MPRPPGLRIEGARQNNLKNVSLEIPHDRLTVVTGVSGSGKSSLAFDTLFAEGQWRYIESLSTYARMFLDRVDRPDVDRIENIRPAIALEQKNPVRTARSTVGTATELLRLPATAVREDRPRPLPRVRRRRRLALAGPGRRRAAERARRRAGADQLPAAGAGRPAGHRARGPDSPGAASPACWWTACSRRPRRGRHPASGSRATLAVVLDRVVIGGRASAPHRRIAGDRAARGRAASVAVELVDGGRSRVRRGFRCAACGAALERPQPLLFSFNHPLGACPRVQGVRQHPASYDEALVVPDRTLSLADGAVEPWTHPSGSWYQRELLKAAKKRGVDPTRAVGRARRGGARPWSTRATASSPASTASSRRSSPTATSCTCASSSRATAASRRCPVCQGARLQAAGARRAGGRADASPSSATLTIEEPPRCWRDSEAHRVGGRRGARDPAPAAGQAQRSCCASASATSRWRARRARCRAARPSASTSPTSSAPSWSARSTCSTSRRSGCTRATPRGWPSSAASWPRPATRSSSSSTTASFIEAADYVVELGPGSGERGGEIVFAGSPGRVPRRPTRSLTARYLAGRESIPLPARPAPRPPPPHADAAPASTTSRTSRCACRCGTLTVRHRRVGLGQVHAGPRHALSRGRARTSRSSSGRPAPTTR